MSPFHAALSAEETGERLARARGRLKDLFAWLEARGVSGRKQLLLYLIYKAYVEPEVIPAGFMALVSGGRAALRKAYLEAQGQLMAVQERFLEAGARLRLAAARVPAKAEELRRRFGLTPDALVELELIARKSLIGELEEEIQASDPDKEELWVCQVEFMLAWKRRAEAQKSYEQWLWRIGAYQHCRKPWVRSQRELAQLLGTPQGTIGRELAELRRELRRFPGEAAADFAQPDSE